MKIGILGAGSWGTALAIVLADNGHDVTIWARRKVIADEINERHSNEHYLPGITLSETISASTDMKRVVFGKDAVLLAVPSHIMRETVQSVRSDLTEDMLLVHVTKGLEQSTLLRMSEVIKQEIDPALHERLVVLSGPSHAEEVSRRSPTTVVVASENKKSAEEAQDLFMNSHFRVYTNPDVVGVEMGGALKNVIALGAGLTDGLGFGDNAKAALMTRGLAEIARLGMVLGANPLTFAGLTGVGDLIVTCTSKHSRNWRAGFAIGQGKTLNEVLSGMGMVVEGVKTTKAAYLLSQKYEVDMPITKELFHVLFAGKHPGKAAGDLMGRVKTHEMEEHLLPFFKNK